MTTLASKSTLDLPYRVSNVLIALCSGAHFVALTSVLVLPLAPVVSALALVAIIANAIWTLRQLMLLRQLQRVVLSEQQCYIILSGNKILVELLAGSHVLPSMVIIRCRSLIEQSSPYPKSIVFFQDSVNQEQFHLLRVLVKNAKFNSEQ